MSKELSRVYTAGVLADGRIVLLTKLTARLIAYIKKHPGRPYSQIALDLDIPINSLMVYAQRMSKAGLVDRVKVPDIHGQIWIGLSMRQQIDVKKNVAKV